MAMAPSHQPFSSLLQPAPPARRRGTCAASAAAAGRAPQLRGAAPSPAGGVFHFPAGRSCSSRKAQSLRCFAAPLRRSQRKQHAPAAAAADAGADDGAARGEGGSEGAHETHHRQQHHTATAVEEQSRPSSNGNGNGHARAHHDGAEGGNGNSSSSATAAAPAAPTRNTTTPRRRGRPAGGEHSKELKLAFDAKQELARSGTLEGVEHAGGAVGEGGGLAPSLARMEVFSDDLERAVNDQINIEARDAACRCIISTRELPTRLSAARLPCWFHSPAVRLAPCLMTPPAALSFPSSHLHAPHLQFNMSYVYSAMGEFFDRDTVGLPGLAKYFRESSDEERGHAQQLMRLQNERGGRVHLQAILHPEVSREVTGAPPPSAPPPPAAPGRVRLPLQR